MAGLSSMTICKIYREYCQKIFTSALNLQSESHCQPESAGANHDNYQQLHTISLKATKVKHKRELETHASYSVTSVLCCSQILHIEHIFHLFTRTGNWSYFSNYILVTYCTAL
jgi:hypothetical protein